MTINISKGHQIECTIDDSGKGYLEYTCAEVMRGRENDWKLEVIRMISPDPDNPFTLIALNEKSGNKIELGTRGKNVITMFGERTCEIKHGGKLLECD